MKLLKLNALCAGLFLLVLAVSMAKPATAATSYEQAHATCAYLDHNKPQQHMHCLRD